MTIIQIDTATEKAQVGIARDGRLLQALWNHSQKDHAAFLQVSVAELARQQARDRATPDDLARTLPEGGAFLGVGDRQGRVVDIRLDLSPESALCSAAGGANLLHRQAHLVSHDLEHHVHVESDAFDQRAREHGLVRAPRGPDPPAARRRVRVRAALAGKKGQEEKALAAARRFCRLIEQEIVRPFQFQPGRRKSRAAIEHRVMQRKRRDKT